MPLRLPTALITSAMPLRLPTASAPLSKAARIAVGSGSSTQTEEERPREVKDFRASEAANAHATAVSAAQVPASLHNPSGPGPPNNFAALPSSKHANSSCKCDKCFEISSNSVAKPDNTIAALWMPRDAVDPPPNAAQIACLTTTSSSSDVMRCS